MNAIAITPGPWKMGLIVNNAAAARRIVKNPHAWKPNLVGGNPHIDICTVHARGLRVTPGSARESATTETFANLRAISRVPEMVDILKCLEADEFNPLSARAREILEFISRAEKGDR